MFWFLVPLIGRAQIDKHAIPLPIDSIAACKTSDLNRETDLIDLARKLFHPKSCKRVDTGTIKSRKLRISVVPAAGYTLQTDFAGIVGSNASFYTYPDANQSTFLTSFTYTVRNQIIFPFQTSLWTKKNKFNIIIDWRYLYFPSYTYGLGGYTTFNDGYLVTYNTIHLHQAVLAKIMDNMYAGPGYNFDYYWNIKELNPPPNKVTDFENYGFTPTEFASGLTLNFLYDNRDNPINARHGNFVNIVYRPNLIIIGSANEWHSLSVDLRKYINFPAGSRNTIAFWNYEWLTLGGKTPYLMLPTTGGDPYSNTGRGYIQGRFRGDNMAYIEGEYRFTISRNGLFGGVVFANAETFTEQNSKKFETIAPGYGLGIRLKFNKFSRTNVALDYGFGQGGSGGLFVNVGEVF